MARPTALPHLLPACLSSCVLVGVPRAAQLQRRQRDHFRPRLNGGASPRSDMGSGWRTEHDKLPAARAAYASLGQLQALSRHCGQCQAAGRALLWHLPAVCACVCVQVARCTARPTRFAPASTPPPPLPRHSDLTFLHQGNPDFVHGGLANITKWRKTLKIVSGVGGDAHTPASIC